MGLADSREFWLRAAQQYVADCQRARTSLRSSEFAERMGLSPARLSREFRESVGVEVSRYLRSAQIESAKKLLREGASPSAVAAAAGFGTLRTFYRAFRRLTGTTPAEYVKQGRSRVLSTRS